jgi:hypothetical protein
MKGNVSESATANRNSTSEFGFAPALALCIQKVWLVEDLPLTIRQLQASLIEG